MRGVRSGVDTNELAAAASRPGIDPRVWLTLATVDDVRFDAEQGVFVDVTYLPDGVEETAYLGAPYSGGGFGAYFPVAVGDTVVVAVPLGDPNEGAVVVARYWNASDPPMRDISTSGDEVTNDVVVRARENAAMKLRTSGTGAATIIAEGSGVVRAESVSAAVELDAATRVSLNADADIVATAPLVRLAEALAAESFVRGTTFAAALQSYLAAAQAQATADAASWAALNILLPNPAFTASATAATAAASAAAALSASLVPGVALSTKIFGD